MAPRRAAWRGWSLILLAGSLLTACASEKSGPVGSRLRIYAADLAGGAKVCDVPKLKPTAGQTLEATLRVANDGGWCGLPVRQDGDKPYDAGLLTVRPDHGHVTIHEVGDDTRIDYTPDRGFAGSDSFAVKLIPGDAVIRVDVTVTPPAAAPKA
jgi:hypothetical protein